MPANKRIKTKYPGVYYVKGTAIGSSKPEKIYYIMYRKEGNLIEEKAGRQFKDDMTPARAAALRGQKIEGKAFTNKERREKLKDEKTAEASRWTIARLWEAYRAAKPNLKGWRTYISLYNLHIKPNFADKEPKDILPLDVKRVENRLLKTHSPQMVKHVLKTLRAICNFGADHGLCPGLSFRIKMPSVNNIKTEDLTPDQLSALLKAIDEDHHPQAGSIMKMALYTGMRRGELFRLKWEHINFERGFLLIKDPKGGKDQEIPLNDPARKLLEGIREGNESDYVFPGRNGNQRTTITKHVKRIKERAGLPDDFRPLHGLRHVYASMLASSGQVDMYTLQKLLTHKDPQMTQRYAHLRDEALKQAANLAGAIVSGIGKKSTAEKSEKPEKTRQSP